MSDPVGERLVVLSPHLDDGVFSLGGTIARASARGTHVKVLTVFGNDPQSEREPSEWDLACGFGSEGEAVRARREEDRRACDVVGAEPVWLSFRDDDHGRDAAPTDVWSALAPFFEWADAVLAPGFPLYHPDHAWLTALVVGEVGAAPRLGFYVEQPYASWRLVGRGRRTWTLQGLTLKRGLVNLAATSMRLPAGRRLQQPSLPEGLSEQLGGQPRWEAARTGPRSWWKKQRAVRAYASQLRAFGPLVPTRMALYELGWGGEGIALGAVRPAPTAALEGPSRDRGFPV
ncbi:MAG TPA: PIG-L family deacetylase [Gaiellaceae bacterium]|nr:PIG-L family deacetylase [Gaiellaceae bacterium]